MENTSDPGSGEETPATQAPSKSTSARKPVAARKPAAPRKPTPAAKKPAAPRKPAARTAKLAPAQDADSEVTLTVAQLTVPSISVGDGSAQESSDETAVESTSAKPASQPKTPRATPVRRATTAKTEGDAAAKPATSRTTAASRTTTPTRTTAASKSAAAGKTTAASKSAAARTSHASAAKTPAKPTTPRTAAARKAAATQAVAEPDVVKPDVIDSPVEVEAPAVDAPAEVQTSAEPESATEVDESASADAAPVKSRISRAAKKRAPRDTAASSSVAETETATEDAAPAPVVTPEIEPEEEPAEEAPATVEPAQEEPAEVVPAEREPEEPQPTQPEPAETTSAKPEPAAKTTSTAEVAKRPGSKVATRPTSTDTVLRVSGLTKRFSNVVAVDSIDLDVVAGDFYGIVGPNGAGKTTTLSMITGLLRPDSGTVEVHGADVWANPIVAKRNIGVLPDRLRLFDRLTGAQMLYYAGVLRGLDRATARSRSNDLANAFGLDGAMSRLVADYSAGMTKKIALAAAMIHSPRLLVLDEPFESVDPVSEAVVTGILKKYTAAGGTVLMSSHSMELVERTCDKVAVVIDGRILADGTLAEVQAGGTLEARFRELAGADAEVEGLEWLHSFSD
ncbi:MAG: ATP-binding cassette domain-containing protein [Rhodoglobus sp.]